MGEAVMIAGRTRTVLFLTAALLLAAVARTAAADDVDGGGVAGGGDGESLLRMWTDGGGEAGDHLNWEGEEDDDDEEDDDEVVKDGHIMAWGKGTERPPAGKKVVSVDSFGAVGDGNADDTQAFLKAWDAACSSEKAVFLVPGGRRYKVGAAKFEGPCKDNRMVVFIQGTIVAPSEPSEWDPRSPRLWLLFSRLVGARIHGGGVIDGSGSKWWASSCKIDKSKPCRAAPTAVTVDSCRGVRVRRLRVQNAQQMHVTVSRSRDVRVAGMHVEAPEDSPNTDGIHVAESAAVSIRSCRIGTGDDCVSISNASFGVRMRNIDCGPGHGISIGSLGKDGSFAAVEDVVLENARIRRAQNGVRIKTWQGGAGYVRNVRFANVAVDDVDHPIVIDQFYCDSRNPCRNQTSNVQVSDVVYRNISGTSRRAEAIKLACSDAVPCRGIVLSDVDLRRSDGGGGVVQAVCNCATGFDKGRVSPAVAECLRSTPCGGAPDDVRPTEDDDGDDDDDNKGQPAAAAETKILHTEL